MVHRASFTLLRALPLSLCATFLLTGPGVAREDRQPRLADTARAEQATIDRLLGSAAWPRRSIVAVRLERYRCDESAALLRKLARDPSWRVRCYANRSLGLRRLPGPPAGLDDETEPRVVRTALRHRAAEAPAGLATGVRGLARSRRTDDRMLAVELGLLSGDPELIELARNVARTLILRMTRARSGALSARLALVTGQRGLHRPHDWQQWLMKAGRSFSLDPAFAVPADGPPPPPSVLAALAPERFAALEAYIENLGTRRVDLAICLDCTASMSGEIAAAQAGIDELVSFVGDVAAGVRVGIVAYRDRQDRFHTRGWDFTSDIGEVRQRLWSLEAEGGGDSREAVHAAMKQACMELSWVPEHRGVIVLVGDAPPHVGFGGQCADLARRAAEAGVTTHVVQADGKDVEHFPEIAAAGGGQCVTLDDDDLLIAEVAGLTLGEHFATEFRDFFRIYQRLCR